MEEELHIERHGSSRKSKRFANKRERLQVKNYLKGTSIEDFIEDTEDDTEYEEIPYKS
mgnify:CR=1 FL=1